MKFKKPKTANQDSDTQSVVVGGQKTHKITRVLSRRTLLLILGLLIITALSISYKEGLIKYERDSNPLSPASRAAIEANRLSHEGNESEALKHAREALALAPDDLDTIQAVIVLIEKDNPEEARQLYQHALEVFKERDNPDADGRPILVYWTAAGLAEKSGYITEAKQYYRKVIDVADLSNTEQQALVKKAKDSLKRLQ